MGAEYNTKNFPAVFIYLSEGTEGLREYIRNKSVYDTHFISQEKAKSLHRTTVALLFAHCTTVITGATCEDHALRTAHEFCRNIAVLTSIPASVNDFRITNMVITFDMWPINIANLSNNPEIASRVTFAPLKFPMAFVQSEPGSGESRTALVSYCGPVIVTGVTSPDEGLNYLRSLLPYLKAAEEKVAPITSQDMCVSMLEYKHKRASVSGGMWDNIGSRNEISTLEKASTPPDAMLQHVASTWIMEDALRKMKASGKLPQLPGHA